MRTFDELWGKCTPNAWARVPRGPVAVAVGSFIFGSAGAATAFTVGATAVTWGTIGGFLITTAVTTWALSALAPRPEVPVRNSLGNIKEATGPFDIVYGEVRKGGVITFLETTDRIGYKVFKDDYLHMVIVLAGHEVEEIGDIYLNDEKVTLNASGYVTSGRWAEGNEAIRIKKHLGSPNQLADPDLVAETSADENFRGRGIAYLYVRMDWDKDIFSSGTPTITAMVKGKKCFDPRTNTTAWTDNSALCIRDYLSEEYGANSKQSPSSMQSPSWITGANVSDINVPLNGGGSEKRYTMNGILSTANSPRANLQKMLTTCGGTLFWGQGQWQFKAGYLPAGPYVSFNADDLRSGIDLVTKNSRKENFNSVTGVFTNKNQDYIEMEYPRINSAVFLARDNGQTNTLDMPLPFTVSPAAAQRLAKMALFRSREEIIIGADFGLKAANVKVGDVIQFTFSRYGFVNKLFEVITWKPVVDGGELKINLVLKETSAAAYSWTAEESQIIGRDTVLPNPTAGLTITGLTVTNRQTLQSDGTLLGEVVLSWNGAETAFLSRYNVQWKRTTDVNWSATTTEEESIILPSVRTGVPYAFRVQAVNVAGFAGPWEQIGATLPGKNTPPGVPTSFTATNRYRAAELNWVNPTDSDLNRVEIYTNTTNSTTGVTKVGESGGTKFIYDMEPMQSRWFFLRAVDHSGNRSAFTPGRQATALFIETNDVDLDVPQLLDDAGLAAVEVLAALPTTGNFVGRTVYLTTDQQLYVWNGTAWVKSVKTGEDILTEFNFPNNLRPIEVVNALPTTGNFVGRMVFLTTDNKMYRRTATGWTAAVASGDITGQLTNNQIAAIDAAKVSGQITGTQISNDAITTPKIAAGAVGTDALAANSVVASKLVLTDFNNLVADPEYYDLDGTWGVQRTQATFAVASGQSASGYGQPRVMTIRNMVAGGAGYRMLFSSKQFPAQPSVEYFASAKYWKSGGSVNTWFRVSYFNESNSYISSADFNNGVESTNGFRNIEISFTPPSTVAYFSIQMYTTGSAVADFNIGQIWIKQKAGGRLIVDGSIDTDKLATNAVTAGKIEAGAITADKIQANAILASKIFVTDTSNMVPEGNFLENGANWSIEGGGTRVIANAAAGVLGYYLRLNPSGTGTNYTGSKSRKISVVQGRTYYVGANIFSTSAFLNLFRVNWYRSEGDYISSSNIRANGNYNWAFESSNLEAPVGAAYAEVALYIRNDVGAGEYIQFTNVTMRQAASAELIVDGAIRANHMSVNSVTAGVIAAGAINTSALLVDGVITASKLNTNSLSVAGLSIFGGDLQSSNFDGAAGIGWRLNNNGTLIVPNASIGTLKIGNNALYVPYLFSRTDTYVDTTRDNSNQILLFDRNIPDFEGGGYTVNYEAYYDSTSAVDSFGALRLVIDGVQVGITRFGIRGIGGDDVEAMMPINISGNASGFGSTNIKVYVWNSNWGSINSTSNPFWLRSQNLTVSGTKR